MSNIRKTPQPEVEIQGQVERITYANEENAFSIVRLSYEGRIITIAGNLLSINPGEVLRLRGAWVNHPKYGQQFKVNSYQSITPATVVGIEKYLGSGLIKGIGPVLAKRLVAKFAENTLDIIEQSVERLKEVDGIGEKRVTMIKSAWEEQREIKEIMLFLQSHGVSSTYAIKIFKHYGHNSIEVVKTNPYQLATDIYGVGFITADKIAAKLGFAKDSPLRAEAGILYVLHQLADDGHVYYPDALLADECMKILDIERELVLNAIVEAALNKHIVIEGVDGAKAVYLAKFYTSETSAATNLKKLLTPVTRPYVFDEDKALQWVQKELSITLAENQITAVKMSFNQKVLVITGGPGTGKTTIINSIIKIYKRLGQRVLLAAPTGRAAKRMAETTGNDARTIHRLLDFSPKDGAFKRNDKNYLDTDLVVLDEVSMVDTILMHHFLKALPPHCTLILVGDIDQLPSVGAGSVLRDIIDSGVVAVVRLNEIFRQSQRSLIVVNAHRINSGEFPFLVNDMDQNRDFYFLEMDEPESIVERIVLLCKERIPEKFNFDPFKDIQVLTAMYKGQLGAVNLNTELQNALNPKGTELIRGGRVFRVGDKVMQLVNNYDKDVFNGDIGKIVSINTEDHIITVTYDGRLTPYDYADLDEITLAYAVTVHKSQGSEYPVVIMPVHTQQYIMLQRNLLYTGVTRGKRLVILLGTKRALHISINNNKPRHRYTYLKERLR
ncbi:SF1B family DNA helicase RecD2 [Candidatus Magnetominusculus xianensis]|uniref:Recombinase RecD n=1 Tax=Candidatus Magnetominusculus xianensis TaxID=1748249 RepID=A0ABR5SEV5_9BACT|nr:ATP-dependent RecD-like DNA helicase [Candidatus Magnetominusculus xianensis]KWT82472.1 recombinase RecD [Candidatus Magnetominusculus xianensis]MBF0403192.1 ATP-dependent RecD-like DNA helicase [Nitrospirota bacterium]